MIVFRNIFFKSLLHRDTVVRIVSETPNMPLAVYSTGYLYSLKQTDITHRYETKNPLKHQNAGHFARLVQQPEPVSQPKVGRVQ
jgi:hypothetical protein